MEHSQLHFYGTSIVLMLKAEKDSMRKEHYMPFFFMNTCQPKNMKLNPTTHMKDHHQKHFISATRVG